MPAVEPAEPQLPPFDHTPAPYHGPPKEEVHALRKQYLSPGVGRLASLDVTVLLWQRGTRSNDPRPWTP